MWRGVRLLERELSALREAGVPLRVVTTTYIGGTEREALDRLVRDFGAEVKIQYDAARTRLHAKAWLFHRNTGFDTAYVGSSNLSTSALLEGVEWNVRLSNAATPALMQKFRATFDSYWNSGEFETYDPDRDRDRLDDALNEAAGRSASDRVTISISGLEVRPFPYQQEMLDAIEVERLVHDRHRNLVVAATGTGKTVIAALDYRRLLRAARANSPSLLFVAHRKEILEQSLRTYREVLTDANFGELYVGGARPERWKHVFASVQSLHAYGVQQHPGRRLRHRRDRRVPPRGGRRPIGASSITSTPRAARPDRHARTRRRRRRPQFFEAEPQRSCGSGMPWRGSAVPLPLLRRGRWHRSARIKWTRGRYDEEQLSNVFTGNDARAAIVLRQLRDKVANVGDDARPRVLRERRARRVHGPSLHRGRHPSPGRQRLDTATASASRRSPTCAQRRVNILFAADLFNEGLDIPDVDTVLFLRPTESATVFLQQLGRGLRRTPHKAVLTVLDFIGYHRKEFRFAIATAL